MAEQMIPTLKETIVYKGGSGTNDYEELTNKPQINGITLVGNKSGSDLKLANSTELTAETTAREDADDALQNNIDSEVTARKTADTTLQRNIDAEATARAEADEALTTNLNAETTARKAGDVEIKTAVEVEEDARISADITLQNHIDAEETARVAGDASLTSKLATKQDILTAGENITIDGATISASFDRNIILNASDANYPADAPTKIYPGYLETGTYAVDTANHTSAFVYTTETIGDVDAVTQIIVGEPFTNRSGLEVRPVTYVNAGSIGVPPFVNFYASTTGASTGDIIKGTMVADNLTTTINPNWVALSANQGKILNDKIGDIQTVLEAI